MEKFRSNLQNIYGSNGEKWFSSVPTLIDKISKKLGIMSVKPFPNLTYNYVASGLLLGKSIVIKLSPDANSFKSEAAALKAFSTCGAVNIIYEEEGILILERASPGDSINSYFPDREEESIEIASMVIKKLHRPAAVTSDYHFPHIREWLSILDKDSNIIPYIYWRKAIELRDYLLATSGPDLLLHGDLHHDNILRHNETWVVIDPKGVIGELAYEIGPFIRNPTKLLIDHENIENIIHNRVNIFARELDISPERIRDWCFVQSIVCWIWALEDNMDSAYYNKIASIFYNGYYQ